MNREPVAKSDWGEGPWQTEPDELSWVDGATGFQCLIARNSSGALCGYVGVTASHSLFRENYCSEETYDLDCHGGLTFSGDWADFPGIWFFGFDCAHLGDFCPGHASVLRNLHLSYRGGGGGKSYKDLAYVKSEVESLARQLFEPLQALADTLQEG